MVRTSPWGAPLLLGALSVALLSQGAYYPRTQLVVAGLLAAALLVRSEWGVLSGNRFVLAPAAGLAGWVVTDAALHSKLLTAVPYLALLAGMLVVLGTCARLDTAARDLVLTGLLGCGVLLALLGWLGLALHLSRWTWQGQGLWRASSTLTYPNATAVLLAMLALVTLARLTQTPRSSFLALSATVLLVGLAATLSRAGMLALAVGVLVLAVARGPGMLARAGWGSAFGAAVAALGLVPAMTASGPRPVPAGVALAAGLAISAGAPAVRWGRGAAAGLAGLALVASVPGWAGVTAITGVRLTVDDPERAASFSAALRAFGNSPLIGAGPDLPTLTWSSGTGTSVYRYAHNEYLQVLAELGIVGGVLLATMLATVLGRLWRSCRAGGAASAGALAAVTALAVHAGFDFIWHIPAIPLVAAALIGLASPDLLPVSNTQRTGETSRKE
jgi:O-antigen ligase